MKFNFFIKNDDLFVDNVDSFEDVDEDKGQDIIDFGGVIFWELVEEVDVLLSWNVFNDDFFFNFFVNLLELGVMVCDVIFGIGGGEGCCGVFFDWVEVLGFKNIFGVFGFRNFIDGFNIFVKIDVDVGNLMFILIIGYCESDEYLFEGNLGVLVVDLN